MEIPKKMKAMVITAPNEYAIKEIKTPVPGPGEVLAKIKAVAICGSDPKIFNGDSFGFLPPAYPFIAGHEWSGEIVSLGPDVKSFKIGDRVAGEAHKGCGFCENCKKGNYNLCLNYGKNELGHHHYGFTYQGAYAEYNIYSIMAISKIPENISYEEASMCDTGGIALHAIELTGITPGGNVVILGPGPVGLMIHLFTKAMGAGNVIMVGRGDRLKIASNLGADYIINYEKENVVERIKEITKQIGADEIFECSGASISIINSIKAVRKGGKIVLIGIPSKWQIDQVPIKDVIMNEIQVLGSRGNPNVVAKVIDLMARGKINVKPLITHTFPLERMHEALNTFEKRLDGAMKVIIKP
ncbi:MAG: alcohol dehydrogenase catalytic domain-containing protein [Candidatus Atribacteria bacterium]|nr:alcohol dehydrogenase catalytic domain-containing protein [Candidatus Atribacteria bacterium]